MLRSFDAARDYVYDVQWNPANVAVFATIDGDGMLEYWDLLQDAESPVGQIQVSKKAHALGAISWSADGRKVLVGDSRGLVSVWNAAAATSSASWTRGDTSERLEALVMQLMAARQKVIVA